MAGEKDVGSGVIMVDEEELELVVDVELDVVLAVVILWVLNVQDGVAAGFQPGGKVLHGSDPGRESARPFTTSWMSYRSSPQHV